MRASDVMTFLGGLLTPLIAMVAVYIAWQQWQTNRQKLILDRYDRRLRIYEEVRKILSTVVRDAKASTDDLVKFKTAVSEADFLFGPEVTSYIDEIYSRGINLWRWSDEYRDSTQQTPLHYNHAEVCGGMQEERQWFVQQFQPAKLLFMKYLNVSA